MSEIRVGQIWASTHKRDVAAGKRQHREVVSVGAGYVWLTTKGSQKTGEHRVRLSPTGKLRGHRLVATRDSQGEG